MTKILMIAGGYPSSMTLKKKLKKCWWAFPKKHNAHHLHGHYITLLEKLVGLLCDVSLPSTTLKTRGVSHCGLAIYIKKYLKAKEELWKLKYFRMQKNNLQKIL